MTLSCLSSNSTCLHTICYCNPLNLVSSCGGNTRSLTRFATFGGTVSYRSVEDIAFVVARFTSLVGLSRNITCTMVGLTLAAQLAGRSFLQAMVMMPYVVGLLNQPKWGHLKDLHKAIKLCEEAMVATDPNTTSLGSKLLEVGVFVVICLIKTEMSSKALDDVERVVAAFSSIFLGDSAKSPAEQCQLWQGRVCW